MSMIGFYQERQFLHLFKLHFFHPLTIAFFLSTIAKNLHQFGVAFKKIQGLIGFRDRRRLCAFWYSTRSTHTHLDRDFHWCGPNGSAESSIATVANRIDPARTDADHGIF